MKTIRNVIYHGMMNYEIVFYVQEGQPYVGARHMYGTIENPHGMYSVPVTKDYGNALFLALKSTKTVSKKGHVYYDYDKALEVMKLGKSVQKDEHEREYTE